MLTAKSESGEIVMLSALPKREIMQLRKQSLFYCPECHERVVIKAGTEVIAHFAHQKASICSDGGGGESAYHEQGKYLLYQWFLSQNIPAQLEVYIPGIKQRPDILIELHGKRIAIEFQCAIVSNDVIRKRNQGYRQEEIIPIWFLGQSLLRRYGRHVFGLNQFTLQFLHQFSRTHPTTLYYFCPQTIHLHIITDVHQISMNRAIGNFADKSLQALSFAALFPRSFLTKQTLLTHSFRQLQHFRKRERRRARGKYLQWQKWLYERGIYIDQLPSFIMLPVRSQHMMKVPLYDWQSRVLTDVLKGVACGEEITLDAVRSISCKYERKKEMFPLLQGVNDPIEEYFQLLTLFGVLEKCDVETFSMVNTIPFYESIHEALAGDKQIFEDVNKKLTNIMLNKGSK